VLHRVGLYALTYDAFRRFFIANFFTNASWFVYNAAFGWLVLTITKSPAAVGFAYFISGLPFLLLTLHAGLLTDRFGARSLIIWSFVLTGAFMFALGALALVPGAPLWLVLVLAFVAGCFQTLGGPAYIAIVSDLVPAGAVSSGVAITFLGFNVGRITGGFLGGVLVALWPTGWALIAAAILQAAPAVLIRRIQTPAPEPPSGGTAIFRPLVEAARHALDSPNLNLLLPLALAPGALGLSYNYLLPIAADEFGIGAEGLGVLLAVTGVGGLAAGLLAERLMRAIGHGAMVFVGLTSAAIGMIVFGLSPSPVLAAASMLLVGGGLLVYGASSLSLIQAMAPPRLRGRLTSLFTLLYWGVMPIGGLIGGGLAEVTSGRFAMFAFGAAILGCGVLAITLRRSISRLRIDPEAGQLGEALIAEPSSALRPTGFDGESGIAPDPATPARGIDS
jgi:MFS family permease